MIQRPRVEILCVGTELLAGKVNSHAAFLSRRLRDSGFDVARETTVADDLSEIGAAASEASARARALVVCGGLGPTFDDLTREGISEAFGRRLVYRPSLYASIRGKFRRYRLRAPGNNRRQAFVISGSRVLPNPHGSAPGLLLRSGACTVALLPGPFAEMQPMFEDSVLPALVRIHPPARACRRAVLRLCAIAEAAADELLAPLLARSPPWAEFMILASPGQVDFHISVRAASDAEAAERLDRLKIKARRLLEGHVYGEDSDTVESAVGSRLRALGLRLAAAESCTGGLLSQRVTSVPGASAFFAGGVVAYADSAKRSSLGVREATLDRFGAVSGPCAREMAEGVRRSLGADAGLAVTGIAGPSGGSRETPVGTVFIALSLRGLSRHKRLLLPGSRQAVRERAATAALWWLLGELTASSGK
jgi:nicotinamide-nucleotide amidase